MASTRLKKIEEYLQQLEEFKKPKARLEQYSTNPHIAAHLLYKAHTEFNDIKGKGIADLGAGCGVLSLGARMLEASYVVGFEIDPEAIEILSRNADDIGLPVETVQCDVLQLLPGKFEKAFDTVIMNPPFGTKNNAGIDMKFLEIATKLAGKTVYSLHKSSTRQHVLKKGQQLGAKATVIANVLYNLPQVYNFHKRESVDIYVDFIRFSFND
ncbi:methyltransferase-like protein 5 [Fopius arisanus]|uniref:Methyltransferase-like protein 5 n=1 Tax=Fopius arisanus TaxID=64838 RepID=A0A9R1TEB4_9HYME|nr:PREDICTED: methyltransferase-like protein 5 [Fopius arisanus]XP_011308705.1 PREDICTED: methyltransferase-like protein 5 [Fopius arisanus]